MMPDTPEEISEQEGSIPQIPWFKKKIFVLAVAFAALALLLPLIFFLISNLNKNSSNQNLQKNEIFYPGAAYVGDELIVKYKDSYTFDEINNLKKSLEASGVVTQKKVFDSPSPNLKNFYVLTFKPGTDIKKVADEFSKLPEFEAVGPNYMVKTQDTPNDPLFGNQWDFAKIGMPNAWQIGKGSNNTTVAVVDTGIDYNHVDFAGRTIIKGPNYSCVQYDSQNKCLEPASNNDVMDDKGHGTHVAGTIGAMTNNGIGVAGENWNVSLMVIKSMNQDGDGDSVTVSNGIYYAVKNGAKIINLSVESRVPCTDKSVELYRSAIDYAISNNVLVVVAAGNGNPDTHIGEDAAGWTPASCNGVMVVGSANSNDQRASSSNFGSTVNIAAPGVDIVSTWPNNKYRSENGTSMAAPHIAGIAALLLSLNPGLSTDQIKSCLINNADPISTDKPIGPRLNAYKTLNACSNFSVSPTAAVPTQSQLQNQYKITGVIFVDNNGNGKPDAGEPGFTNAQIITEGQAGLSTTPDANGAFQFSNLAPGTYSVSAIIGGVKLFTTPPQNLNGQTLSINVTFPVPPALLTPTPVSGSQQAPTPIVVKPTVVAKKSPTPTPVKTYTCREAGSTGTEPAGAIKIGSLVCTPN